MFTRCTLGPQFPPSFHRPFLRYVEGEQGGEGGGDGQQSNTPAFPANTPVKEMTPEQQAAYWQHQSRKHEDRVKKYGDLTPEQVKALQDENTTLKTAGQSAADKAIEEAKAAGRAEVQAGWDRDKATAALSKALEGRIPDAGALVGLDVSKFVVSGKVDTDAINAWVEDNSEPTTAQQQQKKNPDLGGGRRDVVKDTPGDRGRSEASRRFKKKTD